MRKLIAGFILIITMPLLCKADLPNGPQNKSVEPSETESRMAPKNNDGNAADMQSEAYDICLRATQRFEHQEKDKETGKAPIVPLSAACKTELKPAKYWLCMEKEAIAKVDFNAAHWRCAKNLKR